MVIDYGSYEWPPTGSTGGAGTVTSVGLALPASVFTVTGSPVTTAGTLTGSFINQTAHRVFIGPTTGTAAPTFRALVIGDLPTIVGGSNKQVQFNDSGVFGGNAGFTFDKTLVAITMGNATTASGNFSHAQGDSTTASGDDSHAEGLSSNPGVTGLASGIAAHSEGNDCVASADHSHAEGNNTVASGISSHSEGDTNTASGVASHVEGAVNTATGNFSHAEGFQTHATGDQSHSSGFTTTASGTDSSTSGHGTLAQGDQQSVVGLWNVAIGTPGSPASTDELFTVGNGTGSGSRATAFSVRRDGLIDAHTHKISNVVDPVAAQDAATKNYVDTKGFSVITVNSVVSAALPQKVYLCDTSGGAFSITLPNPAAFANGTFPFITFKDKTGSFNTNNITVVQFASEKIEGLAASKLLQTNWGSFGFFSDGTDWYMGPF